MAAEQASIVDTFGEDCDIQTQDGTVKLSTFTGKYVALYFSARWCPPCQGFTPVLSEFYQKAKAAGKDWEVIFCSSDRDQSAFDGYFGKMPWSALPFEQRRLKAKLSEKFGVRGIPALILLDQSGQLYNENGRGVVSKSMDDFPWYPPTLEQTFTDDLVVVDKNGNESTFGDTKGKYVGVYVSAHWCGPCRNFTPVLTQAYQKAQAEGKDFEVIFSSWDKTPAQFDEYLNEMPWKAIPYSNEKTRDDVSEVFSVRGIPSLTILDNTGAQVQVFREGATGAVRGDTDLVDFPWAKKPVNDLSVDTDGIDEKPAIVLMQETTAEDQQNSATAFLNVIGQEQLDLGKERKFYCFTGSKSCDILNRVRQLTGVKGQKMIMLDLQDNGAYYETDLPSSLEDIQNFIEGYTSKSLNKKQCRR